MPAYIAFYTAGCPHSVAYWRSEPGAWSHLAGYSRRRALAALGPRRRTEPLEPATDSAFLIVGEVNHPLPPFPGVLKAYRPRALGS